MSTYTESTWGSSDGTYPSVLTKRWNTTNETLVAANSDSTATGDYTFQQEWSVAAHRLNSLDAVDSDTNRSDSEVLVRFKYTDADTFTAIPYGLVVRGSGSGGSETGYVLEMEHGNSQLLLQLTEVSSGTRTILVDANATLSYDMDPQSGDYIYIRFRVNGSSLKYRAWTTESNQYGSMQEPDFWWVEHTDSTHTANGWVGIYGSYAARNFETDWMSVGTNGDTAPFIADTTAETRISQQMAQVLKQDATPATRISQQMAQVLTQDATPATRISQQMAQVLYKPPDPNFRITSVNKVVMYSIPPPTYIETQWGSSAGVFPTSILTKRWHTANETTNACQALTEAEDGYVLEAEWSASARRFLSWDTLDADAGRDDIELLARFHLEGTNRVDLEFGLIVRGSGTDTTETGYIVSLEEFTTNDIRLQIGEYSSGTYSLLGTSAVVFDNMDSRWCYLRFRADAVRGD